MKKVMGGKLNYQEYDHGEWSRQANVELYAEDAGIAIMALSIQVMDVRDPETFHAAFMVDNKRVRGIDFEKIAIKRCYKIVVPAGWHQNIIDPTDLSWDGNRHEAIDMGDIKTLAGFARKVCEAWNIEQEKLEAQLQLYE